MTEALQLDAALLNKYDTRGPRYTSYPAAPQFRPMEEAEYRALVQTHRANRSDALSVYVHIPFCRTVCYYCGCNKVVTANYRRAEDYLEVLTQELALQSTLFGLRPAVDQLHLGGGTPTYLNDGDLSRLMRALDTSLALEPGETREFSIEIDPRTTDAARIRHLAALGFNRLSIGVQDFDPEVQRAINRLQGLDQTTEVIDTARQAGFRSINLDLIYGLPLQTQARFAETLERVIALRPDRLAVYSYAHLPERFKVQRQIEAADLPSSAEKLALLVMTIERLTAAGYVYIGMDHFALPDDELAVALREGSLQRNFQGYATGAGRDLLALGVSAIGRIGPAFAQNHRSVEPWAADVSLGRIPVAQGLVLDDEDLLRGEIIQALMCGRRLDVRDIERRYRIEFASHFASELERLIPLADDGLVAVDAESIEVSARGRLLLRPIAMAFDAYLHARHKTTEPRYSRVI